MGKKHSNALDGIKIVYHAYQASQALRSVGNGGGRVLRVVKEAILFILVLAASIGLFLAAASAISYVVRVVN
jgi:hypothetical protein